jgi:putative molybdenum carrier protein
MIEKLISGGQTGADRAGLDFAIARQIAHGGWCPRDRWAEDGPIDLRYQLVETPTADPLQRTEWNVRDSDATVIFSLSPGLEGGSRRTEEFAHSFLKPCLHLSRDREGAAAPTIFRKFLQKHQPRILNVAGPRESQEPGVGTFCREVLERGFAGLKVRVTRVND